VLSIRSLRGTAPNPEEAFRQLFQPLVSVLSGFLQYPFYRRPEPGLAPLLAGSCLGTGRVTEVGAVKQGPGSRRVERRVIPGRERKPGDVA
jgi:hypothetical protein